MAETRTDLLADLDIAEKKARDAISRYKSQRSKVEISVSCRVSVEELERLTANQCQAFLRGIAEVIATGRNELDREVSRG